MVVARNCFRIFWIITRSRQLSKALAPGVLGSDLPECLAPVLPEREQLAVTERAVDLGFPGDLWLPSHSVKEKSEGRQR